MKIKLFLSIFLVTVCSLFIGCNSTDLNTAVSSPNTRGEGWVSMGKIYTQNTSREVMYLNVAFTPPTGSALADSILIISKSGGTKTTLTDSPGLLDSYYSEIVGLIGPDTLEIFLKNPSHPKLTPEVTISRGRYTAIETHAIIGEKDSVQYDHTKESYFD